MIVTFISQCEKKAINKTRRVLDAFASRIGDKAWQTAITQDGLAAVKKLLLKTATKNTAVSCHWLRGRRTTELVWIIGNRQKFNNEGMVPINTTQSSIINTQWENDWHYLPLIESLTALAALFHDFGKASDFFQNKLTLPKIVSDPLRHEWVSILLLNAYVNGEQNDEQWLNRLAGGIYEIKIDIVNISDPLANLPPVASLIAWLVVTHHRLPLPLAYKDFRGEKAETFPKILRVIAKEWGYENKTNDKSFLKNFNKCLHFKHGLPSQSSCWLTQAKAWAAKMKLCLPMLKQIMTDGTWRLVLHHSRLALMLGDHHFSSKDGKKDWPVTLSLIANTHRKNDERKGSANQKLDEHLIGVSKSAISILQLLPKLETDLPLAYDVRSLKKKSPPEFNWQNIAVDKIKIWKKSSPLSTRDKQYGFFTVNVASTGCGKTYANAKIMRALSAGGESLRYILALGLRTLTLQTGDEYRRRIGLKNTELAVLVGSKAVMELHKQQNQNKLNDNQELNKESSGSESLETLLDEHDEIDFEGTISEEKLNTILKNDRDRKFLYAPVLVCTIDHMMQATETKKGGRYILPSLRLMSSDLVIDEIDSFDGADLVAIGRLIHLTGMLGRRVMISSATIPPDLAQGYFNAYHEGWKLFAKMRNVSSNIGCAWIDEFETQVETVSNQAIYKDHHESFIDKRINKLNRQIIKRKAEFINCEHIKNLKKNSGSLETDNIIEHAYFDVIKQSIIANHHDHGSKDPLTDKIVSFGLVRTANVDPCIALTEYLAQTSWPVDVDIRVMAYHSRQVLLLRSEQEHHLDQVLKRNEKPNETANAFKNDIIRKHVDNCLTDNMIFILVATSIEEVGRDHDFDWAVVEPSSFRSIIQLAGRVLRHRNFEPKKPNVALMQYNLKALKVNCNEVAFNHPGYERNIDDCHFKLSTHDLIKLIPKKTLERGINALPRIKRQSQADLNPRENLADLEHYVTLKLLAAYDEHGPDQLQGWLTECWWLTALPQMLNPFRDSKFEEKVFIVPTNTINESYEFVQINEKGIPEDVTKILRINFEKMNETMLSKMWLPFDYAMLLKQKADLLSQTPYNIALRYGELLLPLGENQKLRFILQFGLSKLKK
jgi:CRISPR-associated endonuclease/helicase Cas3